MYVLDFFSISVTSFLLHLVQRVFIFGGGGYFDMLIQWIAGPQVSCRLVQGWWGLWAGYIINIYRFPPPSESSDPVKLYEAKMAQSPKAIAVNLYGKMFAFSRFYIFWVFLIPQVTSCQRMNKIYRKKHTCSQFSKLWRLDAGRLSVAPGEGAGWRHSHHQE